MTADGPAPLILTAALDPASQARFERERRQHFPSSLNLIPAHVTLFHHLPGAYASEITGLLEARCRPLAPAAFSIAGIRSLGRGNAYSLAMPAVAALRQALATQWQGWLTAQDRQRWQPHVTIQNKVAPEQARQLHAALQAGFLPQDGLVAGLDLWRYLGGPWEKLVHQPFGARPA